VKAIDARSRSADAAAPRGSLLLTLAILSLYAFLPAPALAATPTLVLDGDWNAGKLRIGGHLDIGVTDGEPLRLYTLLLIDEGEHAVTSPVDVMTDAAGTAGRQRLWTLTGVVGCDPEAVHDPASYQFESFSEAESALDGRTFRVLLVDSAASPPEKAHAGAGVPMEVVTPPVKAYPSDGAGCLRTRLKPGEPVYLAISHQSAVAQDYRIFVVQPQALWKSGDPLVDVRGVFQTISVPANADPWVELLWASPVAGEYQIVVRQGIATAPVFDQATDLAVEIRFSPAGTTDNECDVCPP
jgi:hypothetical protein